MPRTLVLGTGNPHKVQEIAPLLSGLDLDLRAAGSYGPFDPVEDGETLEANALLKARAALDLSGAWSIADDTGLFVDALDGQPGIYAARYAGPGCTFADNVRKLLKELQGVPPKRRTATFICVIALCRPDGQEEIFRGEIGGRILDAPRGAQGFGYDPVFAPVDGDGRCFAEYPADEKNAVSHRGQATRQLRARLAELLDQRPA
jgi:XTP/dITP diphosphohydrolase